MNGWYNKQKHLCTHYQYFESPVQLSQIVFSFLCLHVCVYSSLKVYRVGTSLNIILFGLRVFELYINWIIMYLFF